MPGIASDIMERRGPAVEPTEIRHDDDASLSIAWADGATFTYFAPPLRRECPCARCVNEWTGARMLDPASIADDLHIKNISLVGRYALCFHWSDGHDSGIYSFQYLRALGEQYSGMRDEG
jgi:DUF971 family protein